MPSCPAGRRGGVSAEVYREEDVACYVKKVEFGHVCFRHGTLLNVDISILVNVKIAPMFNATFLTSFALICTLSKHLILLGRPVR